jgi:hypothetical protein
MDRATRLATQEAIRMFRTRFARRRTKGLMTPHDNALNRADTPPDVSSARAKSQRHGKVTADRWNQ